ncbi:hypothetical protein ES703_44284 [subsurface metagenome]
MNHTEVIDKIFKLRKKIGIKQKDMARMINVTGNTLSRWENKKNVPHKIFIKKMEDILRFRPRRREEENNGIEEKNK